MSDQPAHTIIPPGIEIIEHPWRPAVPEPPPLPPGTPRPPFPPEGPQRAPGALQ